MAITVTVYPDSGYNSYISRIDAVTYFEGRIHSDEFLGTDLDLVYVTEQTAALLTAFRTLQELSYNIEYDDDLVIDTATYTAAQIATILKALQNAQCEQALYELKLDSDQQFSYLGIPNLQMTKKEMPRYSPRALAILGPYVYQPTISVTR
ncbi:MAG: hypothetical protein JRE58_10435 [Deltaproteobacteria bacterium]|nr:hypothetical protein [Deltaproteobacteria bacterium]